MKPSKLRRWVLGVLAGLVAIALFAVSRFVCISAWINYGVVVPQCPDGELRQTCWANAYGLRRGGALGTVMVGASARYTTGPADWAQEAPLRRISAKLFLVDAGKETALEPEKGWTQDGPVLTGQVKLPDVRDGDYLLRAKVDSPLGESTVDLPLKVYAPASIHVLTDRPLYEPGNSVLFRAVALRAKDLVPLEGRPGIWTVIDPSGEALLEEKAPSGDWGVVKGSFPLDGEAAVGEWKVRWTSGDASGEASFQVEPFTLPRFRVEASAGKPYHRAGDRPSVRGSVLYTSGAPVAGAEVALDWSVEGEWPAPTEWMEGGLPRTATVDPSGQFKLELPAVPSDLKGRVTLSAQITAIDPAGDRVGGHVSVLLAEEPIQASAVTELGGGLVQGFNNRLFVRVTDAGGVVLPGAEILVKRAWEPSDKGVLAVADEDGVAALQIDPGPAVNVVVPPMPYRPRPRDLSVSRGEGWDMVADDALGLADQRALDGWLKLLDPCARFAGAVETATLGVRVDASGKVVEVAGPAGAPGACISAALGGARLAPGRDRLVRVEFHFTEPAMPSFLVGISGAPDEQPEGLLEKLEEAAADARPCLPRRLSEEAALPRMAVWKVRADSREVSIDWVRSEGSRALEGVVECVQRSFRGLTLSENAPATALGVARLTAAPYYDEGEVRPQATVKLGYEFLVSAKVGGEGLGSARLFVPPGSVPSLRIRPTPVLLQPGEKLALEVLRGPDFSGELPQRLSVSIDGVSTEVELDKKTRTATVQIPATAKGWVRADLWSASAIAYIRPQGELELKVEPEKDRYAPGQMARLAVAARAGGEPTRAAVGLFGVDESLGQLATLPGPDSLAQLRPKAEVSSPAFEVLDAQALAMGRVRGANAAAATVLRVTTVPAPAEIDAVVSAYGATQFDPLADLTDHFYVVLGELHAQVRAWEREAPAEEKMHPPLMARLWEKAIDACEKRGEPTRDGFGRRLKLSRLPHDLRALVEPRLVVVDGTRLPEDIENWSAWVAKEEP